MTRYAPLVRRALVLLLACAACGRPEPRGQQAIAAFGPARKAEVAPLLADSGGPEVTLLDAGREPRRLLRYKLAAGTHQQVALTNKSHAALLPVATMDATTRANIDVEAVAGDGTARVEEAVVDIQLGTPQMGQTAHEDERRAMARFRRRKSTSSVDARGRTIGDGGSTILQYMATALPEEPIGLGARWRVKHLQTQIFVSVVLETTYELVAMDGDHLTLRTESHMSAPPQRFTGEIEIHRMEGGGSGAQELDLTRVMPRRNEQKAKVELAMRGPEGGEIKMAIESEVILAGD